MKLSTKIWQYNWPTMNWAATDLSKEWERFYQHCEFAFGGPLSKCTEKEKICNLTSFVGDKGQEIYFTFQWDTVQVGSGENRHDISERDILERVAEKFKAHLEAKKNPIMAAVKFDRRRQLQGETFDSFVTDLKLLEYDNVTWKKAKTLLSKQPSASVECSRPQGKDCR